MSDPEIRSESELQSESKSTTTVHDAVYEKDNTENEVINVVQRDIIEEHDNVTEAEEVYEEYDGDYEENMPRNKNMRVVQTHENAIEEEVHEGYDGDYQENMPRYATYSTKTKSITQKFLKKKIIMIFVLLVVCTVGVVVGLSIHFTAVPDPMKTTMATISTTTTAAMTISTASTTMACIRSDLLTACDGNPCQNGGTCTSTCSETGDIQVCFINYES